MTSVPVHAGSLGFTADQTAITADMTLWTVRDFPAPHEAPPAQVSAEIVHDFRQRAAIAVPARYGQEWGISPARAKAIRERWRR